MGGYKKQFNSGSPENAANDFTMKKLKVSGGTLCRGVVYERQSASIVIFYWRVRRCGK
jgi:hypothetical protein